MVDNKLCTDKEKKRNHYQTVPLLFFCFLVFHAFLKRSSLFWSLCCYNIRQLLLMQLSLMLSFVCNSQLLPSFCPAISKDRSSSGTRHSCPKAVFVASLSSRRLKCSFHYIAIFLSYKWAAKVKNNLLITNTATP